MESNNIVSFSHYYRVRTQFTNFGIVTENVHRSPFGD
jgi:hypothetical protein